MLGTFIDDLISPNSHVFIVVRRSFRYQSSCRMSFLWTSNKMQTSNICFIWSHCLEYGNKLAEDIMELVGVGSLCGYKGFRWDNRYLWEQRSTNHFLYVPWELRPCFWCNPYTTRTHMTHSWSLAKKKHSLLTKNHFRIGPILYLYFSKMWKRFTYIVHWNTS